MHFLVLCLFLSSCVAQRTIAIVIKSSGVAISPDGNSAVNVSSSPGASARVGNSLTNGALGQLIGKGLRVRGLKNSPVQITSTGKGKLSNIVMVVKSQGVAVATGSGGAVGIYNSTAAGVGVGGAAVINTSNATNKPRGKPNITLIVKSQGVGVSLGSGAAVGIANSPSAGVGVGGSGVITNGTGSSKSSTTKIINGQGVGVARGTGAAVGINNSPNSGTGVGGAAVVGDTPTADGDITIKDQSGVNISTGQGASVGVNGP